MQINRREFLILMATSVAGCSSIENLGRPPAGGKRVVNAGPVGNYAADGVYAAFRAQGFFIIRQGGKLFALSSVCTHRRCLVDAEPNHSFFCSCHGSTFASNGDVTRGPARRNLPVLATSVNENGVLLVTVPAT
jgi:Rieske Fe-S protein